MPRRRLALQRAFDEIEDLQHSGDPVTPAVRAFAPGVELQVDAQRLEELLAPLQIVFSLAEVRVSAGPDLIRRPASLNGAAASRELSACIVRSDRSICDENHRAV